MLVSRLITFAVCASAVPVDHVRYHYKRQTGDLRSPCPALNTLANHGYINRDGKGITLDQIHDASKEVFNAGDDLLFLFLRIGNMVVANNTLDGLFRTTVDLSDYDKHNAIEHDGSLTRKDLSEGDNHSFQPEMLQQLLDDSPSDVLDIDSLAKSRVRLENDMAARGNPPLDGKGNFIAYGEAALILETFGKGTGRPSKRDVEQWFTEERLPDGYEVPASVVSIPSVLAVSGQIQAAAAFHRMFG